ncbi:hypothetical protein M9H77_16461 [Catharanthus roseus]|uniref:Uncharacterized protein n=1 Tax=Catharanthus roseus TaxID=4058 RepID=A0ACC0B266_CATRO|nr:hypothetical protein M9H77_16461 [Catharanthus roseus]
MGPLVAQSETVGPVSCTHLSDWKGLENQSNQWSILGRAEIKLRLNQSLPSIVGPVPTVRDRLLEEKDLMANTLPRAVGYTLSSALLIKGELRVSVVEEDQVLLKAKIFEKFN